MTSEALVDADIPKSALAKDDRSSSASLPPKPRFRAPNDVRRLSARWLNTACVSHAAIVRGDTKRSKRSTTAQYKPTPVPGILAPGL